MKADIPLDILLRQLYKESRFKSDAVSPKGYKGIAQFGDAAISDYLRVNKHVKNFDVFNVDQSIEAHKWYMSHLYNLSYNKKEQLEEVKIAKALAAYNWGAGNLRKFLTAKELNGEDIYHSLDWIRDLPRESHDYIQKILLKENEKFESEFSGAVKNPKYQNILSKYQPIKEEVPVKVVRKNEVPQQDLEVVNLFPKKDNVSIPQPEKKTFSMQDDDQFTNLLNVYRERNKEIGPVVEQKIKDPIPGLLMKGSNKSKTSKSSFDYINKLK